MNRWSRIGCHMGLIVCCLSLIWCAPPPKKTTVTAKPEQVGLDFPVIPPDEALLDHLKNRLAGDPENPELWRQTGTIYQVLSQPDNWDYMERAIELLEKALVVYPEDPQTLIYLGLARASRGNNPEIGLLEKFNTARKGFQLLDQAIALRDDSFALRLLRAKAGIKTPSMLGRNGILEEDRQWILTYLEQEQVPVQDLVLGYSVIGDYLMEKGRDEKAAREWWEKAKAVDSPYIFIAEMRLNGEIPPY